MTLDAQKLRRRDLCHLICIEVMFLTRAGSVVLTGICVDCLGVVFKLIVLIVFNWKQLPF